MNATLYTHLVIAGAALAIGAGASWWIQDQRHGLQLERLQHKQTTAELADTRQAVQSMAGFQKGIADALANFQTTNQRNSAAQPPRSAQHYYRHARRLRRAARADC